TPFLADRNNLVRTWMDHGVWPFLTTQLYLHQTGDWRLLLEKVPYFRDAQLHRGQRLDYLWLSTVGRAKDIPRENLQLKTKDGRLYEGTVLEHILVQTLAQFFNVGEHNNICLEDADWNDGLDMAAEKGESVAFTALYAGNLEALASLLEICKERIGLNEVSVAEEMILLLDREGKKVNYDSVKEKTQRLKEYFEQTHSGVSGKQASIPVHLLVSDLRGKAGWIKDHLNKNEWIEEGSFAGFNGYYDNDGARLEGPSAGGRVRMTLTGQVFPIMAGVPDAERIAKLVRTVDEFLWDKEVGGIRLNTDFGAVPPPLGRAFSFVYGEKENGAIFSHMVVMYANALYQRGFVKEGFRALNSLYKLAFDSGRSCIYPGLPEYFNNEGRGRYMYLTGSASWYILTLLTQVFGVRGEGGNLVLAPKLIPEQFDEQGEARVDCRFAGSFVTVIYRNIDRLPFDRYAIQRVQVGGKDIPFTRRSAREALLQREIVARPKEWEIVVDLG
ncbi:MAG: cellobiose phosphorylase, partial [Elusimicrobia bacterium]|nr:cellobiose phosphorylase [Candidatus Obscuribacterium magneticum]